MPCRRCLLGGKVSFVLLDHLLNHLTADRACLTGSEIAVVTLIECYAYFVCGFHLELLKSSLCFGNHYLVRGIVSHCCFLLTCPYRAFLKSILKSMS